MMACRSPAVHQSPALRTYCVHVHRCTIHSRGHMSKLCDLCKASYRADTYIILHVLLLHIVRSRSMRFCHLYSKVKRDLFTLMTSSNNQSGSFSESAEQQRERRLQKKREMFAVLQKQPNKGAESETGPGEQLKQQKKGKSVSVIG